MQSGIRRLVKIYFAFYDLITKILPTNTRFTAIFAVDTTMLQPIGKVCR